MTNVADGTGHKPGKPEWYLALSRYEKPAYSSAIWQLGNTIVPFLGLMTLALYLVTHSYPYWINLVVLVVASGPLMRMFVLMHDCSHNTFFPSVRANVTLGFLVGVFTLTPYAIWRWAHLNHHATFGNLDRRGVGDVVLMTVEEYQAAPRLQRLSYRLYRHPLLLFGLGSTVLFALIYRFPVRGAPLRERLNVWLTDAAILAMMVAASLTIGLRSFFLVMTPVWVTLWTVSVWFFYIQHQFEGVYWARQQQWDYLRASLAGASYYKLPKLLQWVSGNIGFHHLHHLRPRIPNYRLQQAYDDTPEVQAVKPLTIRSSLRSLRLNLYDEHRQQLIGFRELNSRVYHQHK